MIWFDVFRKYVKSEQEGLEIISNPACEKIMHMTAQAVMNTKMEKEKCELHNVTFNPLILCVNMNRSDGLHAEYSHFIQLTVFAEIKE